ncbi:MAG TPA: hypothetical protein VN493_02880 [Thermoanaerobaculia bacterium]|nr:hypothetical protein [Thermoanaerobaculia bacterium]
METPAKTQSHPARQEIERFVKGEASPEVTRDVVRHLLVGCPKCKEAVRPMWGLPRLAV